MSQELNEDDTIRKRNILQESINNEFQQTPNSQQKGKRTCEAISSSATSASSDDEDPLTVVKEKRLNRLKRILPQSSDKLGSYVDKLLSHLPERFLVPVSMIICCDIMSYMFGFFFGKTPLIKISPKKTWEGFIGGAFSTILFGLVLSYFMMENPLFVCPVESYYQDNLNCTIPLSFQYREFEAPRPFSFLFKIFRQQPIVRFKPFLFHSVVMALFASLIGPFGGFFASGFKRAFKIKDFGDIIPGHGGLMDRFDCQLLMGTFVNVYISSFIRSPNPHKIVQQILWLTNDEQLAVYNSLQEQLISSGLIPPS
uniref:Phosphatidate cytidylyltransferase n=1 Tax=Meloidogyne hapla TaxID=6305 RepID=A0A1I8AYA4_MELHA